MDTEAILDALKAERNKLDRAIAVLQGSGRSPATRGLGMVRRGPRRMSAEARKRISDAQKARWAKVKKSAKKG